MMPDKAAIIVPRGFNAAPSSDHSCSSNTRAPAPPPDPDKDQSLLYERPSFTFIGQDEVSTLKGRKRSDTRKMIRSHVMRDVRRRERIAGLKRISKKSTVRNSGSASPDHPPSTTVISCPLGGRGIYASEQYGGLKALPSWSNLMGPATDGSTTYLFHNLLAAPIYPTIEPMSTLQGCEGLGREVSRLLSYISSTLVPMTFPIETRTDAESGKRLAIMMVSAVSSTASFFAQMIMSAAHKAVFEQDHPIALAGSDKGEAMVRDPTFYIMKAKCIEIMNERLLDPDSKQAIDDNALDLVVMLVSSQIVLGLYEEARLHWEGLKKMVDFRGGIPGLAAQGSRCVGASLTCDLKSACTFGCRPLFKLAWQPQPLPPELLEKILPPPTSHLRDIANTLCTNKRLSSKLKSIIREIRIIFFFEVFNRTDPSGFTTTEHEMFFMKGHEIEYDLLDYHYRPPEVQGLSDQEIRDLNPVETVTRLTALSHITGCFVVSPPKSGMGRMVTKHLSDAIAKCTTKPISTLPSEVRELLAWSAFLSISTAYDPRLRRQFKEILYNISVIQNWQTWREVESVMHGYLYAAPVNGRVWKSIWDEVQSSHQVKEVND